MSPSAALSREEILAVFARGPEAVVALVTALCAQLARATATDSHNSGKPPSTDVTRRGRAPKSLRGRSGRRPGGQPGHRGATLAPRATPAAVGLLPTYAGTRVHDGYASYATYRGCRHALCGVHLLRELTYLAEEEGARAGPRRSAGRSRRCGGRRSRRAPRGGRASTRARAGAIVAGTRCCSRGARPPSRRPRGRARGSGSGAAPRRNCCTASAGTATPCCAVLGTVELPAWRRGMEAATTIADVLRHTAPFTATLTVEYRPATWAPTHPTATPGPE
jgi:transposase